MNKDEVILYSCEKDTYYIHKQDIYGVFSKEDRKAKHSEIFEMVSNTKKTVREEMKNELIKIISKWC